MGRIAKGAATAGMILTSLLGGSCAPTQEVEPQISYVTPSPIPSLTIEASATPTPFPTITPFPTTAAQTWISLEQARAGDREIRQNYLNQFLPELQQGSNIIDIWYVDENKEVMEKFSGLVPELEQVLNPLNEVRFGNTVFYPIDKMHFSPIPFSTFQTYEQVAKPELELAGSVLIYPTVFDEKWHQTDDFIFSTEAEIESFILGLQKHYATSLFNDDIAQYYAQDAIRYDEPVMYMHYRAMAARRSDIEYIIQNMLLRDVNQKHISWIVQAYGDTYLGFAEIWNMGLMKPGEPLWIQKLLEENLHTVLFSIDNREGDPILVQDNEVPYIYSWPLDSYVRLPTALLEDFAFPQAPEGFKKYIPEVGPDYENASLRQSLYMS